VAGATGRTEADILAFLPTLTFTPSLGWSKQVQPSYRTTSQTSVIGAAISQPLFSIPRLLTELKAQNARTEQAVIAYEKSVQAAYGDAETAFAYYDSEKRRVALLAAAEKDANFAYQAKQTGYRRGLNDLQSTLSAEASWRQARLSLAAAQVTLMQRSVQLFKALGGGWSPEAQQKAVG
jgi:outer membrane protein TolC